jgi:AAA+ ATPase superfamily predicted ATPase
MTNFVNRNDDLISLDDELAASRLTVIMGRRRVGKTELLKEWVRRGGVMGYSQAIEKASVHQQISQLWGDIKPHIPISAEPKTWEELLEFMTLPREKVTFVFDEFPYLVACDPSLPSRLQKWLDHQCPAHINLCLLGSSQSMMLELFLNNSAPLYGRARRVLTIKPMAYRYFCQVVGLTPHSRESFLIYSMVGGIPKYWQFIEPRWSPRDAAQRLYFGNHPFFENEILRLTSDEDIASASAMAALEAIGRGAHRPSEIAGRLGMKQTSLTKILSALVASHLVKREIPFGQSERASKRSLYRVVDPFALFHYSVFSPHRSRWALYDTVTQDKILHDHAAHVFEEAFRSLFPSASRYFEGKDIEIDSVRYSGPRKITLSEVKFSSLTANEETQVLDKLKRAFARSQLAHLEKDHEIEFEVVTLEKGLKAISSLERD